MLRRPPSQADARLARLVENLSNLDYPRGFEVMYDRPQQSTKMLVHGLSPIPRSKYQPAPRVVWQLRALHSLTGIHMTGTTSEDLSAEERQHLLDPDTKEVLFFATLMSRDMTWIAPEDAQKEIIAKWKKWYRKNGTDHTYVCDPNVGKWYFH
jgi:hypothetical protein